MAAPESDTPGPEVSAAPPGLTLVDEQHTGEFLRLRRLLQGQGFQLILAAYTSQAYRQALIDLLGATFPQQVWHIPPDSDAPSLVERLAELAQDPKPLHLTGLEPWLRQGGQGAWPLLNRQRETLAKQASCALIFWLDQGAITQMAQQAPDLWAWRAAVLDFSMQPAEMEAIHHAPVTLGQAERSQLQQRLADIHAYFDGHPPPTLSNASLLLEATRIQRSLGYIADALSTAEAAQTMFQECDDSRGVADSQGQIADILEIRGRLEEALAIRRQKQLSIYEGLGDTYNVAAVRIKIADIFASRGQLDEALDLLTNYTLPVFERLSAQREIAVTQSRISDIHFIRGELDKALSIHIEKVLPICERLGELHGIAITQEKIADILVNQGKLDEALSILANKALPTFQRLGTLNNIAISQGKIAVILFKQGQLDNALTILTGEVLPIFDRLGDIRAIANTQGQISDLLAAQGQFDQALELQRQALVSFELLNDKASIAKGKHRLARILLMRSERSSSDWQEIQDHLLQALQINQSLRRQDGIGACALLLAQVQATAGQKDEAIALLDQAQSAYQTLADDSSLGKVQALRQEITGQAV